MTWDSTSDIPDLTGKVAIVTGGNTGLGKECIKQLALHNAKVYLASRTESRARTAIEELTNTHRALEGRIVFLKLDLTDLRGCQRAAQEFLAKESRLDILRMFRLYHSRLQMRVLVLTQLQLIMPGSWLSPMNFLK